MIGVVVAAHSELSGALARTAQLVLGEDIRVAPVAIDAGDTTETFGPRLQSAIDEVNDGDGVIVLTDMFGGTPSNIGMTMHQPGRVEVLTGVNLPMLLKAVQLSDSGANLADIAHRVKVAGQRSIAVATEVLNGVVEAPSSSGAAPQ